MIRGLTVVEQIGSAEQLTSLAKLFAALGFEPGKGWKDDAGEGHPFLAPVGNLELVTGLPPSTPRLLVEVTQLEHIHAAVTQWMEAENTSAGTEVGLIEPTHWNSRLFSVTLPGGMELGFWQSEDSRPR